MEYWGNVTTMREIIKGRDSPVVRLETREGRSTRKSKVERQVSSDWSPCVEEQNGSKGIILQRQGRRHEKGRKL